MKIVTTTVSRHDYDKVRNGTRLIDTINQKRLEIYEAALAEAQSRKVDLLCLPAGYFYYVPQSSMASPLKSSEQRLNELTGAIFALARRNNVAIAVGLAGCGKTHFF